MTGWKGVVSARTYGEAKRAGEMALDRERAKGLVTGVLVAAARAGHGASASWPRNDGDEDWELPPEEHRLG